jgi:hypothetical protein
MGGYLCQQPNCCSCITPLHPHPFHRILTPQTPFTSYPSPFLPLQVSKLNSALSLSCPARLVLPAPGDAAPLWEVWTPSPFGRSSLIIEFCQFLHQRIGLEHFSAPSVFVKIFQPRPVHILLISRRSVRRSSVSQLCNKYCRGDRGRILNEDEVIELLKKLPGTTHEVVDWAELSGREQAIKAARADVFVGMHGAGLTHIQYAHEDAVLVELHAMYVVGTRARTHKNPCFLNPIHYVCQVSLRTADFPVLLPQPCQVAGYAVLRMAQHHRQ